MHEIIVVDDDPVVRILVTKALTHRGYKVITAADGFEGMQKVLSFKPDLVLLDIMMPIIDGMEVLRKIKSTRSVASIPIIMFTALSDKEKILTAARLGAVDYLVKPFRSAAVVSKVEKALQVGQQVQPVLEPGSAVASPKIFPQLESPYTLKESYTLFLLSSRRQLAETLRQETDSNITVKVGNPQVDHWMEIAYFSPDFIVLDGESLDAIDAARFISTGRSMRRLRDTRYFLLHEKDLMDDTMADYRNIGLNCFLQLHGKKEGISDYLNDMFGINLVEVKASGNFLHLVRKKCENPIAAREMTTRIIRSIGRHNEKFVLDLSVLEEIGLVEAEHFANFIATQYSEGLTYVFISGTEAVEKALKKSINTDNVVYVSSRAEAYESLGIPVDALITENGTKSLKDGEIITT